MEQVPALAAAGVTVVRVALRRFVREPGEVPAALEEIANRFAGYRELSAAI
jgi:hypothetical protein